MRFLCCDPICSAWELNLPAPQEREHSVGCRAGAALPLVPQELPAARTSDFKNQPWPPVSSGHGISSLGTDTAMSVTHQLLEAPQAVLRDGIPTNSSPPGGPAPRTKQIWSQLLTQRNNNNVSPKGGAQSPNTNQEHLSGQKFQQRFSPVLSLSLSL